MFDVASVSYFRSVMARGSAIVLAVVIAGIGQAAERSIRVATFNASLYGKTEGQIMERLADRSDRQAKNIASIVQHIRPDILLINEIDYDPQGDVAQLLATNFFAVGQDGQKPIVYPYIFAVSSNTGIDSGMDLNGNEKKDEPVDAYGYGTYPGQYAMAIFSRFPIKREAIRSFQRFLWKDLPNALFPTHPDTGKPYYSDKVWNRLRLSSKNHVDVPVSIDGQTLHLLACHPTPPVFDGIEDHNGCRNHDEIRFWSDYLQSAPADYLVDDAGNSGGLGKGESFVILGDLNSDPTSGDSRQEAIRNLLLAQRVQDPRPQRMQEAPPADQQDSKTAFHTADFGRKRTMRVDYVLPSRDLPIRDSGVFWPDKSDRRLKASDHRMVWVEVRIPQ
ncbi:MAG: endonuclease/exonuclease/phosphatase family protein [Rubripirellula sp.]|nr:endonuclease/exonuclease/phosphatase family protein [Rubripirellula sp.]